MNALVEEILKSPTLPEIVDDLQRRLAEERARREKFYEEITEDQKAEFINGEIIMQSPARERHSAAKDHLQGLLQTHVRLHGLGIVRGEKALCVFPRNDYEPDVCFFGKGKAGRITADTLKYPIPDLIAEILSKSTEKVDRGQKFEDYQAHGVGEYWIIDPDQETLEQYLWRGDGYKLAQKSGTGEVRSAVVAGFVIPVRTLFDAQANLATLRQLLGQPAA
jgi:Uma2 family endonuclease